MLRVADISTSHFQTYPTDDRANLGAERTDPIASCRLSSQAPTAPVTHDEHNALAANLRRFVILEQDEVEALADLSRSAKMMPTGQLLLEEGVSPDHVCLIIRGMALRYKVLIGGQRQVLGYLIAGDLCDLHFMVRSRADHSVALTGNAEVVKIPRRKIVELFHRYPRIERALALSALLDIAILREWLLALGQLNAQQKLAHFFCEIKARLESIGQVNDDGTFELPINQSALADTTGMTTVHINRTLQKMRSDGLICLTKRRLTILDEERLRAVAGFDDSYLKIRQCRE